MIPHCFSVAGEGGDGVVVAGQAVGGGEAAIGALHAQESGDGTGDDAGLPAGLYIYGDGHSTTHSYPMLIEPPPFASATEFTARPLTVGQRYTDPTYGMSFTLQATEGATALVRVDLGESCTAGAKRSCCPRSRTW